MSRGKAFRAWIVAFAALTMVAAACGDSEETTTTTAAPQTTTTAAATTTAALGELPEPELDSFTIGDGIPFRAPAGFAPRVAAAEGICEQYGVELIIEDFPTGAPQALEAGAVDGIIQGGGGIIASMRTTSPNAAVAVFETAMRDLLVAGPDFPTLESLRGQTMGVASFGGDSHAAVLLALESGDVAPEEVTVVQLGGESDRIAALVAGGVQAIPVDFTAQQEMEDLGFHVVADLGALDTRLFRAGLHVDRAFAEENPNTVLVVVACLLEGFQYYFTPEGQEFIINLWAEGAQRDPEPLRAVLPRVSESVAAQKCMFIDPAIFETQERVQLLADRTLEDVDSTQAADNSFLERLQEIGFMEKLGITCP